MPIVYEKGRKCGKELLCVTKPEQTQKSAGAATGEQVQNLAQALPDVLNLGRRVGGERNRSLRLIGLRFRTELLPGPGNCESLLIKQLLDAEYVLHIALAIHALPGAAFHRFQLGKLGFPEAQHVRRKPA